MPSEIPSPTAQDKKVPLWLWVIIILVCAAGTAFFSLFCSPSHASAKEELTPQQEEAIFADIQEDNIMVREPESPGVTPEGAQKADDTMLDDDDDAKVKQVKDDLIAKGATPEDAQDAIDAMINDGDFSKLNKLNRLLENKNMKSGISQQEVVQEKAGLSGYSSSAPEPSEAVSSSQPQASAGSSEGRGVLTPFAGYAVSDPCKESDLRPQGVPWSEGASKSEGPVNSAQLGQYEALLRHTMQGLRLFYGPMSAQDDKSFNAFWAPFFDNPTKEALEYFQQINPLLDELAVTMNNIDGTLPGFGEALEGTLLAAGDPTSGSTLVAAVEYQDVKAQRAQIDDLVKKIIVLGNPPNPLAAKCAARKRHQDIMKKVRKLGDQPGIWVFTKRWTLIDEPTFRNEEEKLQWGTLEVKSPNSLFSKHYFVSGEYEGEVYKYRRIGSVQNSFSWTMPDTFKPGEELGIVITVDAPVNEGDVSSQYQNGGEVIVSVAEGKKEVKEEIDVFIDPGQYPFSSSRIGSVHGKKEGKVVEKWVQINGTSLAGKGSGEGDQMLIEFSCHPAHIVGNLRSIAFFYLYTYTLEDPSGAIAKNKQDQEDADKDDAAKKVAQPPSDPAKSKASADAAGSAAAGMRAEIASLSGESTSSSAAKEETPASQEPVEQQAEKADPENDPEIIKEAIAHHMTLAEQTRRDANRWANDAKAEQDPKRCQELEKRALEANANAQAEQDIADSLRTGTLIHTRTEWDDRQHQALVNSVKAEMAAFGAENKILANIPQVADMVAGAEGVVLREEAQKRISEAIKSPDRLKKLAGIYADLQNKVIGQGEQQMASEQERVDMWDNRVNVAENVQFAASTSIMLGAFWAPAAIGSLAIGYAGCTGFAEGGVKGAAIAVTRSASMKADVVISAYEGATRIDPNTGEPGGSRGAVEGALWSIGTNKAFEIAGGRLQKFKTDYALARSSAGGDHALAKQGVGGAGFKPVAKAKGEARIKEYDFETPEQRFKTEMGGAKTPNEKAAIEKKYAIQVEREKMSLEIEGAKQKAENDIRQGLDRAKVKENYNKDLNAINEKYKAKETRNQEHLEVIEKLGFDAKEPTPEQKAKGIDNRDIKPTGSAPKNASSDMDFTPEGSTPHEAFQKGKAYTEAMKKRGHSVDEYGDRWVDNTNDSTIWKPGFGADKPGSSSFEAEVIFGTLPHSDKFGTKGGIEWTSSATHTTDDPLGAVLANTGKASSAGLGNSHPIDLHTIGKSAAKAAEAAGIETDPQLKAQIDALKGHQTPEQAGVVDLGADQATKDKQIKIFLGRVQSLMASAYKSAKAKSDQNMKVLEQQANKAGTSDEGYKLLAQIKAYKAGNDAALKTISKVSPGLVAKMEPTVKVSDLVPEISSGGKGDLNLGGLARELLSDRDSASKAPPLPANGSDPAFAGLNNRCKEGAKRVEAKIKAAKPGSDEARYLTELKNALEQGEKNPAEAVRAVRGISGTELAVVLAQLGVPAGLDKK